MNRADLRWALDAVIPHAGKTGDTAAVGLTRDSDFNLVVYATDKYTLGYAGVTDGPNIDVQLSTSEAQELLRFIRPKNKTEDKQEVIMLQRTDEPELHVGLLDEEGKTYDSAVFQTVSSALSLEYLVGFVDRLAAAPDEFDTCWYQPKIFARFAKAGREETDRVHLLPKHTSDRNGAALVLVGDHFVGAIAGLTYTQEGKAVA